jgi:mono/diheme cytochrome c family protein
MAVRLWVLAVLIATRSVFAQAATASGPLAPFARAKAESLLQNQLPCLGCHTLNGSGGKLAPELSTVRSRRDPAYIERIVTDPQATVPGTLMPHTPMPPAWRTLIVRYLGGDATGAGPTLPTRPTAASALTPSALQPISTPPADSSGPALYGHFCVACHGARGDGDGPNASSLPVPPARHASRDAMSARSDDALYDTIAGGGAIMARSPRMPAFGTTLSPAQIRGLVRHIRSLCNCTGPAWSTDGSAPR